MDGREWFPLIRATVVSVWELVTGLLYPDPVSMRGAVTAGVCAGGFRGVRLVVGLGNHGMGNTRHSVGMDVMTYTATRLGLHWSTDRECKGSVAVGTTECGQRLVLLKPRLLMNVNGRSVAATARKYGIQPEWVVLVHDDLDKKFGKLRVKSGGSACGHNGIKSCIGALKTDVMSRVRVGIGRCVHACVHCPWPRLDLLHL
jgi:PTH1 family peptidyl-tRNA hydrolase